MLGIMRQAVELVEPTWIDDRGTPRADYENPASRLTVRNCSVQPGATSEDLQNRTQVTIRCNVYLPPNAPITENTQVWVKGRAYSVNGDVEDWESPTGRLSHQVANLAYWEG